MCSILYIYTIYKPYIYILCMYRICTPCRYRDIYIYIYVFIFIYKYHIKSSNVGGHKTRRFTSEYRRIFGGDLSSYDAKRH